MSLGIRSGDLIRSFGRNSPNSLFEIKESNGRFEITIGSNLPYAKIQNDGGFIKATPTTTKSGRKTYRMSLYFWSQYFQHKNLFFKIMALSVQKRGGVTIRPTQYFTKSVKYFTDKIIPNEANKIIQNLILQSNKVEVNKLGGIFLGSVRSLALKYPDLFTIALMQNMKDRGKLSTDPKTQTWVN
jgi:hypothetical protein